MCGCDHQAADRVAVLVAENERYRRLIGLLCNTWDRAANELTTNYVSESGWDAVEEMELLVEAARAALAGGGDA